MRLQEVNHTTCSECGGPAFTDLLLAEKKDACYYKVKASAKVWPSAYASGRLVQCRKKGASNYGNKSESVDQLDEKCWDTHKQVGMKNKGGRQVPNCVPKESVEEDIMQNKREIYNQVYQIMVRGAPEFMKHANSADVKKAIVKAMGFGDQISAQDLASYAYGMLKSNSIDESGVKEDSSPDYMWIQGDFDGDTMVSGPEQGSWRDQQTKQIELTRGRLSNVEVLNGPPPQGGKTIRQARIPLTLDAGGRQFSTTGVDLQLTVAPNGYITKGEYGRVVGTAVVKIMRPGSANEDMAEDYNPEYDDEAGMADNNLETLQRAVEGIDDLIQSGDNLPEWCQEKIAVAKSMLVAVWDYMYSEEASDEVDPEIDAMFEAMQGLVTEMAQKNRVSEDLVWETFEAMPDNVLYETAAWRRKEGKSKKGGLNAKGVASYRRENPGSKLQMAVTTKPSKLKPGSKAAKRRKSFCARMSGVKGPMKKPNGKPTRKALALRKWNC